MNFFHETQNFTQAAAKANTVQAKAMTPMQKSTKRKESIYDFEGGENEDALQTPKFRNKIHEVAAKQNVGQQKTVDITEKIAKCTAQISTVKSLI